MIHALKINWRRIAMYLALGITLSELNRKKVSRFASKEAEQPLASFTVFMVKPELLEAYKRTEFIVDLPDRQTVICHGQRNSVIEQILSQHATKAGAFITAHNPGSRRLSDGENRERHRLLIADVEKQGFAY